MEPITVSIPLPGQYLKYAQSQQKEPAQRKVKDQYASCGSSPTTEGKAPERSRYRRYCNTFAESDRKRRSKHEAQ